MHVANGMYGLILVEPPEGLPPVDQEFYVMQGDFYTVGKYREKGHQAFDMQKAIDENATYVLFNGAESALTGPQALKAKTGQHIRMFIGNGGPNLVSSFHVIGEIFDKVQYEGGTHFQENVQTTLIPAGGAATVEFHTEVPGNYVLVDHSIFRAFNKGAVAILEVSGEAARRHLFRQAARRGVSQRQARRSGGGRDRRAGQRQRNADQGPAGRRPARCCSREPAPPATRTTAPGIPNVFPPLAKSDYLLADRKRAIGIVLNGLTGPVTVNGASLQLGHAAHEPAQ